MSLNSDKILKGGKNRIFVRQRREGDAYVFGGHRREVRRQLINFKIPLRKRADLPMFCTEDGIFWVPGLPAADGVKAGKDDSILYIGFSDEN